MTDDASEWVDMIEAAAMLGVGEYQAAKLMRATGVSWRRRPVQGRSYDYRRADVVALIELRQEGFKLPGRDRMPVLANKINAYWRARGYDVNARVVHVGHIAEIQSDTLNGWPK